MKYDVATGPGQDWAGYITVRDSCDWGPLTHTAGVPSASIIGVEAGMWTEAIHSLEDLTRRISVEVHWRSATC